jgi:hypothetical protein
MSKTMAAEIADRTLEVVNPQNRGLALASALKRHGFGAATPDGERELTDRKALIDWLLAKYSIAK